MSELELKDLYDGFRDPGTIRLLAAQIPLRTSNSMQSTWHWTPPTDFAACRLTTTQTGSASPVTKRATL